MKRKIHPGLISFAVWLAALVVVGAGWSTYSSCGGDAGRRAPAIERCY